MQLIYSPHLIPAPKTFTHFMTFRLLNEHPLNRQIRSSPPLPPIHTLNKRDLCIVCHNTYLENTMLWLNVTVYTYAFEDRPVNVTVNTHVFEDRPVKHKFG